VFSKKFLGVGIDGQEIDMGVGEPTAAGKLCLYKYFLKLRKYTTRNVGGPTVGKSVDKNMLVYNL